MKKQHKPPQNPFTFHHLKVSKTLVPHQLFLSLITLFALFTLFLPFGALGENQNSLMGPVYAYIEEEYGYTKEELDLYTFEKTIDLKDKPIGYMFGLKIINNPDPTSNGIFTRVVDQMGNFSPKDLTPPKFIPLDDQIINDYWNTPPTMEGLYHYKGKWAYLIPDLRSHFPLNDRGRSPLSLYENLLLADLHLPEKENFPREEALEKAKSLLLTLPNWNEEVLAAFVLEEDIYFTSPALKEKVYRFHFSSNFYSSSNPISRKLDGKALEKAAQKHDALLSKAFGGEENVPLDVFVTLNPITGEQIGEVVFDYPPTKYAFELLLQ